MVSSDPRHGDRIPPRAPEGYRLLEWLGGGGFGEVWKAEGPGPIVVALKFVSMSGHAATSEGRSLGFLRYIRHPNLLVPFAFWQIDGHLVIGMDLADGTLHDRLSEVRAQGLTGIPRVELHRYMWQASEGIDHLNGHRHDLGDGIRVGVQHRDVKPQNILLFGVGVRVADFGLARLLERSATGHTGGLTFAYAAPEFFSQKTSDRSDQYSLGVTYCELRGGRRPFVGTPLQLMYSHVNDPPDLGMLPSKERAIVERALAKVPDDRWPDCRAFVTALRASRTGGRSAGVEGSVYRPYEARIEDGPKQSESQMAHQQQIHPGGKRVTRWLVPAVVACLAIIVGLSVIDDHTSSARNAEPPRVYETKGPVANPKEAEANPVLRSGGSHNHIEAHGIFNWIKIR